MHLRAMDFLVFSHLRWNFVFQRPQHLLSRFASRDRVFFWEEPCFDSDSAFLETTLTPQGVTTVVPHLPANSSEDKRNHEQHSLLMNFIAGNKVKKAVCWYYNPMAVRFTQSLSPEAVVYDCMDELSGFRGAPPGLQFAEAQLFKKADLVFTGGQSLYEAKRRQHRAVYCFPSSIDREFFETAATIREDPEDQANIPHPRLGYSGVIDERMDVELLANAARLRPDWHFVMVGPVVKINEAELPKAPNIHWLGGKQYRDLPRYMSGWEVGLLPFARNESTRFISPTKTPEYLAAGLPVVSTSIADVVRPYGRKGLAYIADEPGSFVSCAETAIASKQSPARRRAAQQFLQQMSWDSTWERMAELVEGAIEAKLVAPQESMNDTTFSIPGGPSTSAAAD